MNSAAGPSPYWSQPPDNLLAALCSAPDGLSATEAKQRLQQFGPNALEAKKKATPLGLFLNQFRRRFRVILLTVSLVALVGLSVACRPRSVAITPPVEGTPVTGVPLQAASPPAPPDPGSTIRFERISAENGLSQNAVLAIAQDQRGFMWFGTEDGLNKYDGYQFTVYKQDPADITTLSSSDVRAIYEDGNGVLWVGTRNGLNRFDWATGTFTRYQHDPGNPESLGGTWVVAICEDHEGTFWVGTDEGGLARMDRATGVFTHYQHDPGDPTTLSEGGVRVIYEDRDGELWIGTDSGLDNFDRATGTFVHYWHEPGDPQSLSDNKISAILEDRQGALWIGTEGGGLNQFDRSLQTFVRYRYDPDDPGSLSHDRVRAVFEDSLGRLWIGTQNGLDLFDRNRNQFVHYQHNASDPYSLSSNSVWSIYEDRTGVLWFGTYGGGLNKYNRTTDQFALYQSNPDLPNSLSDNMVWSIYEDRSGILWVGTFNGGLNRLDRESGTVTVYRHDPEDPTSLSSDDVRAIWQDRDGVLWVGTGGGLDRFDPDTETFTHYRYDPGNPNSLSEDRVLVLREDRSGRLWVGTRTAGLNRFDHGTETFVRYRYDEDDPFGLSNDRVWALYEDSAGALWVGTLGGVSVWDPATDRFTRYLHDADNPQSLSNDAVFAFYEDPSGTMWIGTWGSGLDCFDRATRTFTHYTEKDGLANDVVYGIETDSAGFLWLSTNRGLSKFDPRTETFQNYDVSDGLQDNEFNVGAHFKSDSGEMFFGGIRGFNAFYPEQVTGNPHVPPIVITAFSKFNQIVRRDLSSGEHIQLSYRDNFVSFEFAALDYTSPEKNQYAYMLEGQDQGWVDAGMRRYASYTNLKGGDYVFRVKGSNNDGVWNEEGATVYLAVTPPIWETWWFQGLAVLALVSGVLGGYRLRVRSIQARSRELESQVRERTREIEQRTQELEALYRADEEMLRYLKLDRVLQALVDVAVDILQADKSALMVWDDQGEKLAVRAAHGFSPESMAQMSFARGEETVGLVAVTGEPVIVEDVYTDSRVTRRIVEEEGIRSFAHVPIKIKGEIFGVFNVSYIAPRVFGDELRLFTALAQRAAMAIENAQLYEQAQELAVVEERQRLARDLHDAVTQTLFSASLIAEVLPRIWERDAEEGWRRLAEVRELTRGALAEMRTLLLELRPSALVEAELGDLLRQLAEATTGRARVPVSVKVEGGCSPMPPEVKVALYRIAQEALNNVAKHAGAGRAEVSLRCGAQSVELDIADDGGGFDVTGIPADHLGLGIMRERAEAIGAELRIESGIGRGTQVSVVLQDAVQDES